MLENNIGIYDVIVDFDNIGKKDRTEIKYSENDINSARVCVKCQYKGENIDLSGCDILIRTQAGENRIEDVPSEVDTVNSVVKYIFPTNALINGINHIEIMVVKGDWVKTSPKIYYRVFDGIGESDDVADVNYPILISLIKDVRKLNNEVVALKEDVIRVNENITNAESLRVVAENERKANEVIRISNENERKSSFATMQSSVGESLANVDSKMATVKSEFDQIKVVADQKATLVDNKVSEMNALKDEVIIVKNNTEEVRVATEKVKNDTLTVKNDTVVVKNETNEVKVATELVKNNTESTRVATEDVKTQAEAKIVNVESRMKHIEDNFDSMVNGTGFATKIYVDTQDEKKANKTDVYTKAEVDVKIDNVISGGTDKNIAYGTTVTSDNWLIDSVEGHYVDVVHNLATRRFSVEIVDTDTNEKVQEDYRIINENTVRIRNNEPINAMITVINGNAQTQIISAQIDDVNVSTQRTFSSSKIMNEINKISVELNGTRTALYNELVSSIGKL